MHHVPRFFKRTERMNPKRNRRKLERLNAVKHTEYDAALSSSSSSSSSSLVTRSLDLSDRTSFRIEGIDGEIDRICISLGLSGPEDLGIPEAAWEARKIRSSSDLLPRSRLNRLDSPDIPESPESEQLKEKEKEKEKENKEREEVNELCVRVSDSVRIRDNNGATELTRNESAESSHCCSMNIVSSSSSCGGGIKGARPPLIKPPQAMMLKPPPAMMLKPPPAMTLPVVDNTRSTWDLFRDFAPESESSSHHLRFRSSSDDEEEERDGDVAVDNRREEEEEESLFVQLSESSCSFTTNDDDWSPMSNISPNGRIRRVISPHWQKGVLLGRGSFGSVYEGISE